MKRTAAKVVCGLLVGALGCVGASSSQAATILRLDLGGGGPDVSMTALGVLSTASDGVAGTTGDQNTDVEFTGFLNAPFADITTTNASFSLSNVKTSAPASVFGSLVIQAFSGGIFSLYDPANNLLLEGPLTESSLSGATGPPGTGALFTTTLGSVTGGSLKPTILPGSVSVSVNLVNVNGGAGFSVLFPGGAINPFVASASIDISALAAPEPATWTLMGLGSLAALASLRKQLAASGLMRRGSGEQLDGARLW